MYSEHKEEEEEEEMRAPARDKGVCFHGRDMVAHAGVCQRRGRDRCQPRVLSRAR